MIKAQENWTIIAYEREKDMVETTFGMVIPSARNQRKMLKGTTHVISANPDEKNLPDVIRIGTVVSSDKYKKDTIVLFNKHDGFGFEMDKEFLYAIKSELIMATLD